MAKGKKGKGRKQQNDSDSEDGDDIAALITGKKVEDLPAPKPKGKKGKKPAAKAIDSDSDDDGDDIAALITGASKKAYDSNDDESEEDIPKPAKGKKNKGKKPTAAAVLAMDSSSDENEDEEDEEQVQQVAVKLADDWGVPKKKKKEKKEKKEKKKKDKKKKKEKDNSNADSEAEDDAVEEVAQQVEEKLHVKSKLELQMEKAMQKKEETHDDEEEEEDEPEEVAPPAPDTLVDTTKKQDEDDGEVEEYYGHGDQVWSDKSHALREAEESGAGETSEKDLMYGPDGKKLSNKERKKLQKAKQAAEREAEYEKVAAKASKEGAQFACSQTAVNESDQQWENSLDISIPSFSISAAGKILFKDASLTIGHGRRYGLIGPNGKGKSTLLKMIHSGDLKLPPRIDFLYVEQEVVADDTPAVEAVLRADTRRWDLMAEEQKLMVALDKGDESEETFNRLQAVVEELTNMNADAAEAKARRILYGLGFTMDMQTKPTKMFSGGWRMRISLARALFIEPTLLMLDEPTNHLDLNAVIWLDEYLQTWKKTLIVVSHDQDFLNSVCQECLHIEDLKLISYKGNYDSFKKAEHQKFLQQVKAWEKQEKRLKELKRSGQSKAKATETMKSNQKKDVRAQKKKNQAIAAGTEAAEATELIKRPREYAVKIEFPEVAELSRPVMEVNNVHFRYSPKHPVIFDNVDFGIDMDSRITIVGPNGAGKSTLLKLLTGEVDPTTGEVKRNPRLRMGIYNQHFVDRLPMTKTPVEYLRDRYQEETYQSIRNRLGKYGLEGHAHEVTMRDLSGGQKARVVFVDLSLQEPHILLLDEPTNNLDIESIDALCEAINEFNGGVVVVTHDQRLIEECECTLWVVEKRGVTRWDEGFEDYKATILRELEEEVEREAAIRREKAEAAAKARADKLATLAKKLKK